MRTCGGGGGGCCITSLFQVQGPGESGVQPPWIRKWQLRSEREEEAESKERKSNVQQSVGLYVAVVQESLNGTELILFPLESHLFLSSPPSTIQHQRVKLQDATRGFMVCAEEKPKWTEPSKVVFSSDWIYQVQPNEPLYLFGLIKDVFVLLFFSIHCL